MSTKKLSTNVKIWNLAESLFRKNRQVRRCDVIRACLTRGMSHGSVMTQVPAWVTARAIFTQIGFVPGIVGGRALAAKEVGSSVENAPKKVAKGGVK